MQGIPRQGGCLHSPCAIVFDISPFTGSSTLASDSVIRNFYLMIHHCQDCRSSLWPEKPIFKCRLKAFGITGGVMFSMLYFVASSSLPTLDFHRSLFHPPVDVSMLSTCTPVMLDDLKKHGPYPQAEQARTSSLFEVPCSWLPLGSGWHQQWKCTTDIQTTIFFWSLTFIGFLVSELSKW